MTSCHLQYSFTSTPLQLATHHLLLTTYYSLPITTHHYRRPAAGREWRASTQSSCGLLQRRAARPREC